MIAFSFISDKSCPGVFLQGRSLPRRQGGGPIIECVYNPDLVKTESLVEFLSIFKDPLAKQARFTQDKEAKRFMDLLAFIPEKDQDSLTTISLLEELQSRGYDLKTLKVEIRAQGQPVVKRIGRQTPGRLRSLYTRDEDGSLDVICWWRIPGCSKRDVNMLFCYFSGPAYTGPDLPALLKKLEFNPQSFLFQIDHCLKGQESQAPA